ncbi:MAG: hypothetical protein ACXVPN_10370 [Bacteroidia bacterium]
MTPRKIKGGALYITIFISLIISIFISLIILLSYYSKINYEQFLIEQSVLNNAQSAIAICLEDESLDENKVTADLYEEGKDSVEYSKKWWGCYKAICVNAHTKGFSRSFYFLAGSVLPSDTSLILKENGKALSLCGETILKGTCFLPKSGLERAYIEGQNFVGDKLIYGETQPSPNAIPSLNEKFIEYAEKKLSLQAQEGDSLMDYETFLNKDSIVNSFLERTLVIQSSGTILLSNKYIKGNVLLCAGTKIVVEENSFIEDALLVSPQIEIKDNFSGSLQGISSDTIRLGKEVKLNYPSSLTVLYKEDTTKSRQIPAIILDEKSVCNGSLVAIKKNEANSLVNPLIKLGKETKVQGLVYSQGYTDIQGSLTGTLITNGFILVTPSSVYENHLLNAVIDRKSLSQFFAAGLILDKNPAKKIVKWLN